MDYSIAGLSEEIIEKVTLIRHDIHQHPETGHNEFRTAEIVEAFLDEIDVGHTRCTDTGVVASIGSGNGHNVALRADIDALPMPECSGIPYASVNEGFAHACGHDGHTAVLLGAAWVLKRLEDKLNGTVKLIWQPDEEGGTGAKKMIEHGVLDDPSPEAIFALHCWPDLPACTAGYRFGSLLASVNTFKIVVKGKGCHGAQPNMGIDPIVIAARIVEGLQLIRSRMINPVKPIVISVCTINGGSTVNVIPDEVTLAGTIRTLDPETRSTVHMMMKHMAVNTAHASGGDAEFRIINEFPPTLNDDRATAFARDVLFDTLGRDNTVEIKTQSMGGEDFSYFLEKIPGSFLLLGVGDRTALHNTSFDFNDKTIATGIRIMSEIAVQFVEQGLR